MDPLLLRAAARGAVFPQSSQGPPFASSRARAAGCRGKQGAGRPVHRGSEARGVLASASSVLPAQCCASALRIAPSSTKRPFVNLACGMLNEQMCCAAHPAASPQQEPAARKAAGATLVDPGASADRLSVVSASYVIRATWATGYVVDVSVVVDCLDSGRKNRFGVDGWSIEFEVEDGSSIVKAWNAKLTQDGSVATAHHKRFCAPVYREQALLYFGFEAMVEAGSTFQPTLPKCLKINGQVCAASACFARDLADCRNDHLEPDDDDEESSGASESVRTLRAARCATPEPARIKPRDVRQMSAPPVLCRSFGITPRRFGAGDEKDDHLATTCGFCAESKGFEWGDDEDHSIAETVRHRHEPSAWSDREIEVEGGVEGKGCVSTSTPPMSGDDAACGTNAEKHQKVLNCGVSRKRKFLEEDDGDDSMCCQMSSVPPSPCDAEQSSPSSLCYPKTLTLDYYRRSKALKKRKYLHMDYLDTHFRSREKVILDSVLDDSSKPIVMEPNMFPYDTPGGVSHWTLWSRKWLEEDEVEAFVDGWLAENLPQAVEWNHDDNMADGLSINLFHLHVYIRCS